MCRKECSRNILFLSAFCVSATVGAGRCPTLEQLILLPWASDAHNRSIRCPEQKSQFGSSVVMTEMRGRGVGLCFLFHVTL